MLPERYPPDDPREWLRLARGDAALTRYPLPSDPVAPEELGEALASADAVLLWAQAHVSPEADGQPR